MEKELLPQNQSYKGLLKKNYQRAKYHADPTKKLRNEVIELEYFRILKAVKKHYSTLSEHEAKTVYEQNRKGDRTCLEEMHEFVTSHFIFNLYCDIDYDYQVDYQFFNCPFKAEIQRLFNEVCMITYAREIRKKDFEAYYNYLFKSQRNFFKLL